MFRRILWLLPILLLAGYAFYGRDSPEYRDGYQRAVEDAGKLRDRYGWAADAAGELLPLDRLPLDPGLLSPAQSEEWREGYRAAMEAQQEELRR